MANHNAVDILLVEDNANDVELTTRALRRSNLANQMYTVRDGAEAVDFLFGQGEYAGRDSSQFPRVVLLDLNLPKINGLEVLQIIKEDPRTRRIPVVVVSSSRDDPDIERAYLLGANSYVIKPVHFDQFASAMSSIGLYWLLVNQPPVSE